MGTIQLDDRVGQDVAKRGYKEIDHVPQSHSKCSESELFANLFGVVAILPLLNLVSLIPTAK